MKVRASVTPSGVKATSRPSSASGLPSQPVRAYSVVRAIPATAVGSAKGRSTRASTRRRPGKRYRASTHATQRPKTALIDAATAEAPKVSS